MGYKVGAAELIAGAPELLHGFSIEDESGASILTLAYTSPEEADARKTQVRTILKDALLLIDVGGRNHCEARPSWYLVQPIGGQQDDFLRGFSIDGDEGTSILKVAYRIEDVGARMAQMQMILKRAFLVIDGNGKNHLVSSVQWWTPIA